VNKYADVRDARAGTLTVIGGTSRLSIEGTALIEGEIEQPPHTAFDEVVVEKNKCGCTNYSVKVMAGIFTVLTIIFIASGIGTHNDQNVSSALWTLGIISLIASCVNCNILWCACCQYPKGADE
jgi:hypothetical protein